ncbi:MAG TPA: cupin domain-containing protein, partial [Thermoanaerobaculia bacterium]|nr:cupin domain-containing protein [Thermoanaerobaculia bacterium]
MRAHRWMAIAGVLPAISLLVAGPVGAQVEKPEPSVIAAGEGHVGVSPNGVQTRFKVGSVSTGASQVTVAVGVIPPGHVSPMHLHEIDEEVVYVLQGELTAILDGEEYTVGPG